jgi:uncharacterized cupin superfamily protein
MKKPVHESSVEWQVWAAGTKQEVRGRALCDVGGRAKIGVGVMELPPGCDTRPAHYHSLEEEHLYVLDGRGVLHLGGAEFALEAGSYVCFPPGQPAPHCLENRGDRPLRYLMIGERIGADVVAHEEAD